MGLLLSRFMDGVFATTEKRILMVGLDAAGKTTILYKLKLGEVMTRILARSYTPHAHALSNPTNTPIHSQVMTTIPTIGFNVETVDYKKLKMTIWDVGGQDRIRQLWRHYYHGTNAVIFVLDSNDRDRIDVAKQELHKLIQEEELRGAALLVFANKQDLPNSMSTSECVDKLGLHGLNQQAWYVQSSSAVSGDGLYEGLDWLQQTLAEGARRR